MSTAPRNSSANATGRQPSRLQRRAPTSLQIRPPASSWNVAIPLLSPLASSPKASERFAEREEPRQDQRQNHTAEPEKLVFKTWQHPAAPFCSEPAPFHSFVPVEM
ncbi:hypothetical protein SLA2020_502300 [Shorea laevis]